MFLDPAPSDFYYFPLMKWALFGQRHESNDVMIGAAEAFFEDKETPPSLRPE